MNPIGKQLLVDIDDAMTKINDLYEAGNKKKEIIINIIESNNQ